MGTAADQLLKLNTITDYSAHQAITTDPFSGTDRMVPFDTYIKELTAGSDIQVQQNRMLEELAKRTQGAPRDFINEAPNTLSQMLFMPLDTYGMSQINKGLQDAYPWLKSNQGLGGTFMGAYSNALMIQDPETRSYAMRIMEHLMSGLGQSGQAPAGLTAAMSLPAGPLRDQALQQVSTAQQQQGEAMATEPVDLAAGPITVSFDAAGQPVGATITTRDITDKKFQSGIALLWQLFPNLPIKDSNGQPITFDQVAKSEGWGKAVDAAHVVTAGIGTGLDGVLKLMGHAPGPLGQVSRLSQVAMHGAGPVFGRAGDIAELPLTLPMAVVSDIATASEVVGEKLRKLMGRGPSERPRLLNWVNPLEAIWPSAPGTGLARVFTDMMGVKPTDPSYSKLMDVGSFITQWAGTEAIGDVARAAKGSRLLNSPGFGFKDLLGGELSPEQAAFRRAAMDRYGFMGGRVAELLSKTPDQFETTRLGRKFESYVMDTKLGGGNIGDLMRRFPDTGMPIGLARTLMNAENDPAAMWAAYKDYLAHPTDPGFIPALRTELRKLDDWIANEPQGIAEMFDSVPATERAVALVRRAQIEDQLAQVPDAYAQPAYSFPKASFARRVVNDVGDNSFERSLAWLYDPPVKYLPHIARLFDYMGHMETLYNPFRSDAPGDALEQNTATLRRVFHRLGVSDSEIDRVVSKMGDVRNMEEWHNWIHDDVKGFFRENLDGTRPAAYLYPRLADRLLRATDKYTFTERARLGYTDTVNVDGIDTFVRRPVLSYSEVSPFGEVGKYDAPWHEGQFEDHFRLPPTQMMIDATSTTRNLLAKWEDQGGALKSVAEKAEALRGITDRASAVLRAWTLYPRMFAILIRSQGEQALRNMAVGQRAFLGPEQLGGFAATLPGFGSVWIPALRTDAMPWDSAATFTEKGIPSAQSMNRFIGLVQRNSMEIGLPREYTTLTDTMAAPGVLHEMTTEYTLQQIESLRASAAMQQLIRRGQGGFMKWLEGDTPAATTARTQFDSLLSGTTLGEEIGNGTPRALRKEWASRSEKAINDLFRRPDGTINQELRRAFITGEWTAPDVVAKRVAELRAGPQEPFVARTQGSMLDRVQTYDRLKEEVAQIEQHVNEEMDDAQRMALRSQRQSAQASLDAVSQQIAPGTTVSVTNREAFKSLLEEAFQRGDWAPPRTLNGYRNIASGAEDIARAYRRMRMDSYYASMRLQAKLDPYLSRGAFYYQRASQITDYLESMGIPHDEALASASFRAARETAQLHYDLTTRTSAQLAFRHMFWFAPVVQDVLKKWFVDIPSEYSWPVGMAINLQRAHLISGLVHNLGLIHSYVDSQGHKHEYVLVPGLAEFLSKIGAVIPGGHMLGLDTLSPKTVSDIVSFNPSGLNLVAGPFASGEAKGIGSVLSLSPQWALPLNLMAPHFKAIEALANSLEPFGQNTQFGPYSLIYAFEALTGKEPSFQLFSPGYQHQQWSISMDHAIQQAVSELEGAGRGEPLRQSYATDYQYQAAHQKWSDLVLDRANHVYRGWAFVRLLGSTVFPAALHVTDNAKLAADNVKRILYGTPPPDQNSPVYTTWEENRARIINDYLSKFPNSFAYLTSVTESTKPLPYSNPGDSNFFAQLASGARKTLDPKDYLALLAYQESFRHYTGLKSEFYDGKSVPDILTSGYQRLQNRLQYDTDWAQYKTLNGDGTKQFEDKINALVKAGETPTYTFETQRLSTVEEGLQTLATALGNDGIRNPDLIKAYNTIRAAFAPTSQYGPPKNEKEKAMAWYWDQLAPYYSKLDGLYTQISQAKQLGQDTSVFYAQLRSLNNEWNSKSIVHNGVVYPSPEAVTWGNLAPDEQNARLVKWASQPVTWLSDFARSKVGYKLGDAAQVNKYIQVVESFDKSVQAFSGLPGFSSALPVLRQATLASETKAIGPAAVAAFALDQKSPAERIAQVGPSANLATANGVFQKAIRNALSVRGALQGAGFSPNSNGTLGGILKQGLFTSLFQAETPSSPNYDSEFAKLMEQISLGLTVNGVQGPRGALEYNALFFGDFGPLPANLATPVTYSSGGAGTSNIPTAKLQQNNSPTDLVNRNGVPWSYNQQPGNTYVILQAPAMQSLLDIERMLGMQIQIDSSFRTLQKQTDIWNSGVRPAAHPGFSLHEQGLAIDVDGGFLAAHPNVRNLLTSNGWFQFNPDTDPGHFSYGVKG